MGEVTVNLPAESLAFVQKILGPVAEAGEFLTDKIRYVRWKSSIKTLKRAQEIAQKNGISPKEVPVKFIVPFLEKASLEDESDPLIERWASLLANASGKVEFSKSVYIDILSKISNEEASLLDEIINPAAIKEAVDDFPDLTPIEACRRKVEVRRFSIVQFLKVRLYEITHESLDADIGNAIAAVCKMDHKLMDILFINVWFNEPRDPKLNVFESQRDSYRDMRFQYDVLASLGLISTITTTMQLPHMLASWTAAFPTALGIDFIHACRVDSGGTP